MIVRRLLFVTFGFALAGCKTEEEKMRVQIAGSYVRELRNKGSHVRQVLSLREDGTWLRTGRMQTAKFTQNLSPDSGTYRILNVTVNLRSLVETGAPIRYTIVGDTLFQANAAELHAISGYDIGEEKFIRSR
ncbi:MAG: hypothetical protein AB1762_11850 [Gemmatimonadota bacterium]